MDGPWLDLADLCARPHLDAALHQGQVDLTDQVEDEGVRPGAEPLPTRMPDVDRGGETTAEERREDGANAVGGQG